MKTRSQKKGLARFYTEKGGNFVVLFALLATVIFGVAGLALDYARALNLKIRINNALDAATLATARAVAVGDVAPTEEKATDYFKSIFAANMEHDSFKESVYVLKDFELDKDEESIFADVSAVQNTTFLRVAFGKTSQSVRSVSKASFKVGNSETAMVLDVTSSMGSGPGSRLDNLKQAAKLGISTLLAVNTQYHTRSRVSLVPYSYGVNAGPLADYVFPDYLDAESDAPVYDPDYLNNYDVKTHLESYGAECANLGTNEDGQTEFECTNIPYDFVVESNGKSKDGCATDRKEPASAGSSYQFSDANPSYGMISRDSRLGVDDCPSSELVLLSRDETMLKDAVDDLSQSGFTAGHIGLQWAWYTISHNWVDYIAGTDSDPGDLATDEKLAKYIILMTDGIFNTAFAGNDYTYTSYDVDTANDNTVDLCAAIKAQGIKIFTIGYMTPGYAEIYLEKCASPDEEGMAYFYKPETAQDLMVTYETIGRQIQQLNLSQ